MTKTATGLSRRAALILPLAAALPHRARAAMPDFVDAAGRTLRLKAPAERIVLGFNFEEFTAVAGGAAWNRVVGFTRRQWAVNRQATWRRYIAAMPEIEHVADIGAAEDQSFSAERVLALRPDLVVIHAWGYANLPAQMKQIEQAGIPVLVVDYNAQNPDLHVAGTLALGHATGSLARAQALADGYRARIAEIRARLAGVAARPRAYVELGQGGPGAIGNSYSKAMWGGMLDIAGGANIADGHIAPGWKPLAPELVLAATPAFVFMIGSIWASQPDSVRLGYGVDVDTARASLAAYARRSGWDSLPAIRDGQLHGIEATLSRSLLDWVAIQYMAKQMFPDRFGDLDPVAALRRYHATYLPIAFDGTWMIRAG